MKVLYPLEVYFPSQGGGPANTVFWVAKNVRRHGIEPIVCATNHGLQPDFPTDRWIETESGCTIYVSTRNRNFPLRLTLVAIRAMLRADAVHLSSIFFPSAFIVGIFARLLRKPVFWSPRGELDPAALIHSSRRKTPILWLLTKLMPGHVAFHSTCDEETAYIRGHFGKSIAVKQIPNFLEIPAAVVREPSDYFLYIGRIHPKKAIDNLLRAISISRLFRNSDFVLKIAGTGPARFVNDLKALTTKLGLDDKVEFLGQVEGTAKQKLLADAHWTFMPSHTENFGLVVIESMAQSTPVVASTGTPWRILESEKVGIWADNDPDTLARIVDRTIEMPRAEYERVRADCRPFVERNFDIEKNVDIWLKFYGES